MPSILKKMTFSLDKNINHLWNCKNTRKYQANPYDNQSVRHNILKFVTKYKVRLDKKCVVSSLRLSKLPSHDDFKKHCIIDISF